MVACESRTLVGQASIFILRCHRHGCAFFRLGIFMTITPSSPVRISVIGIGNMGSGHAAAITEVPR